MYAILNEFNQPKRYLVPFIHAFIDGPQRSMMLDYADDDIVVASDHYKSETGMCSVWHIGIRIYFEVVKLMDGHAKDIRTQCLTSEE